MRRARRHGCVPLSTLGDLLKPTRTMSVMSSAPETFADIVQSAHRRDSRKRPSPAPEPSCNKRVELMAEADADVYVAKAMSVHNNDPSVHIWDPERKRHTIIARFAVERCTGSYMLDVVREMDWTTDVETLMVAMTRDEGAHAETLARSVDTTKWSDADFKDLLHPVIKNDMWKVVHILIEQCAVGKMDKRVSSIQKTLLYAFNNGRFPWKYLMKYGEALIFNPERMECVVATLRLGRPLLLAAVQDLPYTIQKMLFAAVTSQERLALDLVKFGDESMLKIFRETRVV